MELYILRHGIAEEISKSGRDRDRRLTEEGEEKSRLAGKALRELEIEFDLILSSPFARAWRTAELVAEELQSGKRLRECEALSSGAGVPGIVAALKNQKESSILIVGHEPELSQLISVMISGSGGLSLTMKKGALCKLTCVRPEPGAACLEWLLGPKHLSRMA